MQSKKQKLLTFILPTVDKLDLFTILLPSLKNIGRLKDYATFSIIFQNSYTEDEINICLNILHQLQIDVIWEQKNYTFDEGKTPLLQMRQDCALKVPTSKFYAFLDDDMEFLPGIDAQYIDLLYLMLKDDTLSVAAIQSQQPNALIPSETKYNIGYNNVYMSHFGTGGGLIVRGGSYYNFEGLMPSAFCKLTGGLDDEITALHRMLLGGFSITCTPGACIHYNKVEDRHSLYTNTLQGTIPYLLAEIANKQTLVNMRNKAITDKQNNKLFQIYKKAANTNNTILIEASLAEKIDFLNNN